MATVCVGVCCVCVGVCVLCVCVENEMKMKWTAIRVTLSETNCCRGTVQPQKWQLTGIDCSTVAQASGSQEPSLTDYWAHSMQPAGILHPNQPR